MSIASMPTINKLAYLFIMLGENEAIKIFEHLSPMHIESISQEIVRIKRVDGDVALAVLEEFYVLSKSHQHINSGGYEYAAEILNKAMGKEAAKKILDKLSSVSKRSTAFKFLNKVDPIQLGKFLKDETPQTIAIVLSHMGATSAAETINSFEDSKKVQITLQMATIKDISPEIIHTISSVLEGKIDMLTASSLDLGGVKVAADMLNRMSTDVSKEVINQMKDRDEKTTKQIKENMFIFEDLLSFDGAAIQALTPEIDTPTLTVALKNAPEEIQELFISNMSSRAQGRFYEEFDMLTKVKAKDMEAAQRVILDKAQEMLDDGRIERDDEE